MWTRPRLAYDVPFVSPEWQAATAARFAAEGLPLLGNRLTRSQLRRAIARFDDDRSIAGLIALGEALREHFFDARRKLRSDECEFSFERASIDTVTPGLRGFDFGVLRVYDPEPYTIPFLVDLAVTEMSTVRLTVRWLWPRIDLDGLPFSIVVLRTESATPIEGVTMTAGMIQLRSPTYRAMWSAATSQVVRFSRPAPWFDPMARWFGAPCPGFGSLVAQRRGNDRQGYRIVFAVITPPDPHSIVGVTSGFLSEHDRPHDQIETIADWARLMLGLSVDVERIDGPTGRIETVGDRLTLL
jgi:hypothetical protein